MYTEELGMRIIKRATLAACWQRNPQARSGLLYWHKLAKKARWTCLQDARTTFPRADAVQVASGRSVVVFNIAGSKYRLIMAVHYNRQLAFTLMVLTHAEYSREKWKESP
jgi:mRNA interferase HigB